MRATLILLVMVFLSFLSCKRASTSSDFNNELVDLIVKHSDGNVTQIFFPYNYDVPWTEKEIRGSEIILAEKLKQKGFTIIERKFEGYDKECASIKVKLVKESCECTIYKVFEYTKLLDHYRIRENINCKLVK